MSTSNCAAEVADFLSADYVVTRLGRD